ncbi:MAG TPA: MauE/DoxX family redox-associated membrane protein [Chthoniobacteraceae bacterium]|nr:MauE/DoxX family redox-associated membrane protein [Chthoniobacteraceae bacterium]
MISTLLRFALAAVFIYAGVVKILDAQRFALDVQHYDLTPWTVSVLVAVYLPWLEVIAGIALIVRRQQLGALVALGGMTAIFLGALLSAWARGLDISCGCFGRESRNIQTNFPLLLAQDLALLFVIGFLFAMEVRRAKAERAAM